MEKKGIGLDKEALQQGWRAMKMSAGLLWEKEDEIKKYIYERAKLRPGQRVLFLGEANEACGFPTDIKSYIGESGELIDIDFRSKAYEHLVWNIYEDLCESFQDESFDVVITLSWHHIDDVATQAKALMRVVKKGGQVIMLDHGPGPTFFELMKLDVHTEMVSRMLVTYWGSLFHDDLDAAYDYAKDFCLRITPDMIESEFGKYLTDMGKLESRGLMVIYGTKK